MIVDRKFRLAIERNGSSFSDICEATIEEDVMFMSKNKYKVFFFSIPKWMRDMLDEHDYKRVRERIDEMGKELYRIKDGERIVIKLY